MKLACYVDNTYESQRALFDAIMIHEESVRRSSVSDDRWCVLGVIVPFMFINGGKL